ncbi:chromosome segregation protein SMC [Corynebacterium propinquum]|uniref:Chromosome partition protein Smc n=1 Tax=Corynebacterium propinquum TaxID=43769 RepID=A0ABT7FZW9_9CORY|nr:chromosome segregation protein SMC [Corynebacterium propinquum]MCT1818732.1 chromosome segregation protein SMC [Corynebacterium propinquum]MDK4291475.1 chromosome segregation protein SMC [Corynebacterium propinquum]MDK4299935.1 chromosome segregation protein SMC [Corynebacterium propinquum]MDK4312661.1 chromosome segregation protein SMC [Corynebacterium propinquum]
MHLKALTLKGFKSFASATTMKFEPGICAVVGPNGSGKSNVVDALAWVMGEGSAKTLRGGKMQDVIFAGAGDRKPLGRAEVTLTIDNADGQLPIEYTEVSLTRRMFRDGASEYEINGAKARLADIQELLSDSGIGREMHVIVGQGKLSEILESKPEERRAYIEEAAGVLKHRRRREKAQRKLTGMQANLDRLQDLTDELSKQLKPLARQAETARKAATVQAEVREARLVLAGEKIVRLRGQAEQAAATAEELRARVDTNQEHLEEAESRQSEAEAQLSQVTPAEQTAQNLWFRLSALSERIAATVRIAADRARNTGNITAYSGQDPDDLEARALRADEEHEELVEAAEVAAEELEEIREEVAELNETVQVAEREHLARLRAESDRREGVVRLVAEEESIAQQLASARENLARAEETGTEARTRLREVRAEARDWASKTKDLRGQRENLAMRAQQANSESKAAEQRLDELRENQRERERVVYTLQSRIDTLQAQAPQQDIREHLDDSWHDLVDLVRADAGWEAALSAALGEYAKALAGPVSAELLAGAGDSTRAVLVDTSRDGAAWHVDTAVQAEWLVDHITVDSSVAVAVGRVLADVVVAEDYSAAVELIAEDPRLRAVTRDGLLVGEGWVEVGSHAGSAVERSSEIAKAQQGLRVAQAELEQLSGTIEGAKQSAEEARLDSAHHGAALREHDTDIQSAEREEQRVRQQVERYTREYETAAERAEQARARSEKLETQHREVSDRLARVDKHGGAAGADGVGEVDEETDSLAQQRQEAQAALSAAKAREMDAAVAARSAQDRAGQAQGKGDALRRQAEHERVAKRRHEQAMARRKQQAELAEAVLGHAREIAERAEDATDQAARRRDELTARRTETTTRLNAVRSEVSAARRALDAATKEFHQADMEASQASVRVEEAENKAGEQLGIAIEDLVREYSPGEDFDRAAETRRLKRAEKDLGALGKVNPLALEEFKAMEERYNYLSQQLDDVIQTRHDLQNMIADVDQQILELFTQAWKDVEAEFPRVFATLFPGGEARLLLTEPDDMLTTGIEVEARPPGKKVKRLSLLSGGEKSLTALAMLVAIFRARPSPFYVMDEVEAALDDVNLRRLLALFEELRKDSQLIVITHQKPTMDVANVLYGVTMRSDGITHVLSQRLARG